MRSRPAAKDMTAIWSWVGNSTSIRRPARDREGSRSSPTTCRAALTVALSRAGGDLGMARLGLRRQVAR